MGNTLTSRGTALTLSQKIRADIMGITHGDMKLFLLGGLSVFSRGKKFDKSVPSGSKRKSGSDVLVIGGGPSIKKNIRVAKKFDGIVCVVDNSADYLAEQGIRFDYLISLEKGYESLQIIFDKGKKLQSIRSQFTLVYSGTAQYISRLMKVYASICDTLLRFDATFQHVANVGLYGIQFAEEHLKARRIFLLGFDGTGTDIDGNQYGWEIFLEWQSEFKRFMDGDIFAEVINCTPRSKLIDKRMKIGILKDIINK